jgi:hypothetical protein
LTTTKRKVNSVPMNTHPSLYPVHPSEQFYVAYLRDDQAKEPLGVSESIPRAIADAAAKTGRPRHDFEVEEIARERYEKLKQFLG